MLLDSPIQITALSGRLLVVFCVYTWLVQLPLYYRIICIVNSFVSADRRATARTTTSLSHAAIRQKNRPHGVIEVVLGQEEFSFPTVLPITVNVVLLGEFLAPFLLTGLPGLQWQAWINGELLGLALVACQEGFFLQVQVWCGPTLMQNMVVAAPLLTGTLHFDMEAMTDTSLVRVTIYIPGGNTLISSRVLSVTCLRTMLETCALGELRSRFSDLREVGFRVIPVHPAVTWNAPILTLNKEKWS